MKFAKDTRPDASPMHAAEIIAEALPWIKNVTGKTVVIKYGGSAMVDPALRAQVMSDIVLLKIIGLNPVIVHGGGKAISRAMKQLDLPVAFKDGMRITDDKAMRVVSTVLVGEVNQDLVRDINQHGNLAVGVSGSDAGTIVARQLSEELGRVGAITAVHTEYIDDVIANDYIPVVAGIAMGEDGGSYNINADVAAGEIAAAIGAQKIIFLTDVDGLYRDFEDKDSLISNLIVDEAKHMLETDQVSTGMIPKLTSCVRALDAGVQRAHIINGTTPHALLLELLTDSGVGTTMHATEESYQLDMYPLGRLASKLNENADPLESFHPSHQVSTDTAATSITHSKRHHSDDGSTFNKRK